MMLGTAMSPLLLYIVQMPELLLCNILYFVFFGEMMLNIGVQF